MDAKCVSKYGDTKTFQENAFVLEAREEEEALIYRVQILNFLNSRFV